jgi:hypothetical protein
MPWSAQRGRAESAKLCAMDDQFEASCPCGAVRFVAAGQPEWVALCHCESCRKHSGAPVYVFVGFKRDAYVVTQVGSPSSIHRPADGEDFVLGADRR